MKEKLIVFTRYPEAGKTKTRLIPVLGKEGAAKLHQQLTEGTISQAKQLKNTRQLFVEVYFTGGSQELMEAWLGNDIFYQNQVTGDLGLKMAAAFEMSFNSGVEKVVLIGTDCPGLNADLMAKAFNELEGQDLVLGPALDGGYYLIGLRRFVPEIFMGINWGTAEVLAQSVAIAHNLKLAIAYLSPLADIDRPEDLSILDFGY
ncbi:TIGR04282 family arsenosugar biosynthesis glycosyltransferase [Kamptonema animale CS-326]|jgi:rSAM/selenodomain-associated transferase 1|uniref:TIGR04282 family arsenosugar biosynthesis glycosyltransferase n=1 Tax=Kamptonema animale TaxID=92934 RepID=UPI00232DF165|nr:TIGR04282 family arsenosugar biosynthesis glycosyltransferase [Kamptonema animale]MDB9514218.1 TIGR04282 family arsenosugar biosynthesis glycosyltransferase [Kamptonema animale CS-326]